MAPGPPVDGGALRGYQLPPGEGLLKQNPPGKRPPLVTVTAIWEQRREHKPAGRIALPGSAALLCGDASSGADGSISDTTR